MRIQHNIPAMSSYRNYTNNNSALAKNLEKLSSGYKINRAGDDAAGLAISEKMRAQITGLEVAQKNAKDGISLVQTAEGALTEVHSMLNRMYELAEQSANGTYSDDVDREQLQKEVSQLRTEINRIADSSNFNGINLLDGSMSRDVTSTGVTDVTNVDDADIKAKYGFTAIYDGTPFTKPEKAVFTLNLHDAKISVDSGSVKVTVGTPVQGDTAAKTSFEFTVSGFNGIEVSGDDVASAIFRDYKTITLTDANKEEYTFDISQDSSGILRFTSQENVNLVDLEIAGNGSTVTANGHDLTAYPNAGGNHSGTEVDAGGNNGSGLGLTVLNNGMSDSGGVLATSMFTLSNVSDGMTITIGDETYIFAIGENSQYADLENAVDLTAYDKNDENIDYYAAAGLSKVAEGNKSVKVEVGFTALDTDNGQQTGNYILLTEKKGGLDRDKYDVIGPNTATGDGADETNAHDATWAGFVKIGTASVASDGLKLQIGDTADKFNQLTVSVRDCHAAAIGIGDIDISTQSGAASAMEKIKSAINYISDVRGTLGATQNRLDHTINNLSVMQENIQDAESTIRDVDVAKEMMEYTKNNILVQSAQAMLAQANQLPQGVLQLLQ